MITQMKRHGGVFSGRRHYDAALYDFSTPQMREKTAEELLEASGAARQSADMYWKKMRRYYDGLHDINYETDLFCENSALPWTPAQSADGYVHVESQIEPEVPDFEFSPRLNYPASLAKQREEMVRLICDMNGLADMNIRNERRLGIKGSAVWKVGVGDAGTNPSGESEVVIENPLPEQIYADPNAMSVDACEYIAFVYPMHKQKAFRVFEDDIASRGEDFESYFDADGRSGVTLPDRGEADSVTVTEFWFRQPRSGECTVSTLSRDEGKTEHRYAYKAGDVALTVLINGKEVKYIPKYWQNTDCNMFPFVIYSKVPSEDGIWGKSELEHIIPIIDAADRELAFLQLNSAFSSNDVILAEENAFSDGETPENTPGAIWKLRPGMMGKVQRLGNLSSLQGGQFENYSMWQNIMEETTGNFDTNQGKEPLRVTTASGIALLNERAKSRQTLKKAGKSEGFKRLFTLIDYTALEFYEDGRFIKGRDSEGFDFSYSSFADASEKVSEKGYIPSLDVKIHLGDAVANSKAFTISAINSLISADITPDNFMFVKAYVDMIGLPMRKEICAYLDEKYAKSENYGLSGAVTEEENG